MPYPPGICYTCGTAFIAKGTINIDGKNAWLSNIHVGPCPNCGGWGRIPDGIYSAVYTGTQKALTAQLIKPDQIKRLIDGLRRAMQTKKEPAEIANWMEAKAPPELSGWAKLIRNYRPTTPGERWGVIKVVLALLALLYALAKGC